MIEVGARAPDARVWLTPQETVTLPELWDESGVLLLFYLFDWSST